MQWVMRRNCSITPRQLMAVYVSLCAVSLGIAAGFWIAGAPTVLAFAGLELLMLGLALTLYARHATDCETIILAGRELAIEHRCGQGVERASFRAEWVRVEPASDDGSLVELVPGRSLDVPLYWQHARAASTLLEGLSRAIVTAASQALLAE